MSSSQELRNNFYREKNLVETVFDVLKTMRKTASVEPAARLDINHEEVLNELWELKKAGSVDKSAYTWRVTDNNVQQGQLTQAKLPEEITTATVARIPKYDSTATIGRRGPQAADELTTSFGTTSYKVASTLAMAISKGCLIRIDQDGEFRYYIPGGDLPAGPKTASVSPLWLSASSSTCHGVLIIIVIAPLPTKNSMTKMPENWG